MTAFSLGTVWEETFAFVRRESSLLIPVALATFGTAQLVIDLGMGGQAVDAAGESGSPVALLALPAILIMLIGNLTITRMALVPAASVGESLAASLRRIPRLLVVVLILFAILMGLALIVVTVATLGSMAFRTDPKAAASGVALLLSIPMFIVAIRLMLLIPVLAIEDLGPLATLRRAWAMSREHFLRFFGVMMIILLVTMLLGVIQLFVLGSLFKVLAFATGASELATIVQFVVNAAISAILSLAASVFIARIYRHIVPAN